MVKCPALEFTLNIGQYVLPYIICSSFITITLENNYTDNNGRFFILEGLLYDHKIRIIDLYALEDEPIDY